MKISRIKGSLRRPRPKTIGSLLGLVVILATMLFPGSGVVYAQAVTVVDDGGADDYPGQKDLNQLTVDYASLPSALNVTWNWDDTAWSGNNTGDACSLYDTDGDGFANYSLCVVIGGSPATYQSTRLYSCGDEAADRCTQPVDLILSFNSTCSASVVANSDPFGVPTSPWYDPNHVTGNTCSATPGCYTADVVATCSVDMTDFGTASDAFLLNVCSYPAGPPNSAPSECVIAPNSGFLTIVKDAGDDTSTGFTFNMGTGQTSQSGDSSWTITGSGSVDLISFAAGSTYDLSEVVPAGWNLDDAECRLSDGTLTGTWSGNTVTDLAIQTGRETTCTFTDSLAEGTITVIKHVVNDSGGTAVAGDFTISLNDTGATTFPGDESGTTYTFAAGYAYNVTETGPAGYAATFSGDCSGVIEDGVDKTCTITNDDQQAYVTVVKNVINDNGGSAAPDDFLLTLDGGSVTSGVQVPVNPGTYTAGETQLDGYTFEGFSGDCDSSGDTTVALGESKTCTLTNNDQQAYVIVEKVVTNDNGGSAAPDDFNLTLDGSPVTSGVAVPVNPGTYTAGETQLDGYTFEGFSGDCDTNGDVTVALGETKTCTLTNDDQPATKSGHKWHDLDADGVWDAGEPGLPGWTIQLWQDGQLVTEIQTGAGGDYAFPEGTLVANVDYLVCEVLPDGWYQSFPTAAAGELCPDGSYGYPINLQPGEADTDNDFGNYQMGSKSGRKWHDYDADGVWDAGEPAIAGWTIELYDDIGNLLASTATDGEGGYAFTGLMPGQTYYVCEEMQLGWVQSFPAAGYACSNGTVGYEVPVSSGQSHESNDFGNYEPGSITIIKEAAMAYDGWGFLSPELGGFVLSTGGSITFLDLLAGEYNVTEDEATFPDPYWYLLHATCVDNAGREVIYEVDLGLLTVTIHLQPGQDVTCTFFNERVDYEAP